MKKTFIATIFLQCLDLYCMPHIAVCTTDDQRGSLVTTLVNANYFDGAITKIRQDITSEIARINSGETTVEQAIVNVTGGCKVLFDSCKSQINERYLELVVVQQRQKQLDLAAITSAKDQEIRTLQQRLDTILSTHTDGLEGLRCQLRLYDQQRIEAEHQVRTARELVDPTRTVELVTETQLNRTIDRLTKDLRTIRTEIQDGKRTLEDAFSRVEEKYCDNIQILLGSLEDRYYDISAGIAEKNNERTSHLTAAYERQIELMRYMLDEAVAAIRVAEENANQHMIYMYQ